MAFMFLEGFGVNQEVIEVCNQEIIQEFMERVVNVVLERTRGVAEAKRHNTILE